MNRRKYKRAKAKKPKYRLLTTAQAKALLDEQKVINHTFNWRAVPDRTGRKQRLDTSLEVPFYGIELKLSVNLGRTNYSFSLIYQRYPIRIYNVHGAPHHNPDSNKIYGPHKQDWNENYLTDWAYNVNDISTDNINSALKDFLKECNIELRVPYQGVFW